MVMDIVSPLCWDWLPFTMIPYYAAGCSNCHCLCQTCEINQQDSYAPYDDEEVTDSGSAPNEFSSDNDKESNCTGDQEELPAQSGFININEQCTQHGVYAILPDDEDASGADLEPNLEPNTTLELASVLCSSLSAPDLAGPSKRTGILTPEMDTLLDDGSVISTCCTTMPAFMISTHSWKV